MIFHLDGRLSGVPADWEDMWFHVRRELIKTRIDTSERPTANGSSNLASICESAGWGTAFAPSAAAASALYGFLFWSGGSPFSSSLCFLSVCLPSSHNAKRHDEGDIIRSSATSTDKPFICTLTDHCFWLSLFFSSTFVFFWAHSLTSANRNMHLHIHTIPYLVISSY